MQNNSDFIGKKFGRLEVISFSHKDKYYKKYYVCKCCCGNFTTVLQKNLISGNTKSCGCLWKEKKKKSLTKHNMRHSTLYGKWAGMIQRTKNKNKKDYKNYGGRGIKVCEEWSNKKYGSSNFISWALKKGYRDGLTIDRIDVNGNYCPENCRWIGLKEQQRNKRNNNFITYKGKTLCATDWETLMGFRRGLIYARQKLGWSVEKILTTKSRQSHY